MGLADQDLGRRDEGKTSWTCNPWVAVKDLKIRYHHMGVYIEYLGFKLPFHGYIGLGFRVQELHISYYGSTVGKRVSWL